MNRILRWHIPGVLSETGVKDTDVKGNAYKLDRDYIPVECWVRLKSAPSGMTLIIDINDDGTSIFSERPVMTDNQLDEVFNTFASPHLSMLKDSIVTLDIDQVSNSNPGEDLVVELWLTAD